jgi:hypothetical protein
MLLATAAMIFGGLWSGQKVPVSKSAIQVLFGGGGEAVKVRLVRKG